MAAKKSKKKSWSLPPIIRKPLGFLVGPGRSFALALLAVAVVAGSFAVAWHKVAPNLLAADQYQVTADRLDIPPLPPWIRTDPRPWVIDYLTLKGPLSIMDDDAAQRVADAFKLHPWVEQVARVTKHHPAQIRVELIYRQPVCMVVCPIRGKEQFTPVDAHGVWLPGDDVDPRHAAEYPIVLGITSPPVSLPGMPWGDQRIAEAAAIAAAFGAAWNELHLHQIVFAGRVEASSRIHNTYDLYTRNGRRILWGRASRSNTAGEASTEDKIARLRQHAAAHGGLDAANSREPIDVRYPNAVGRKSDQTLSSK